MRNSSHSDISMWRTFWIMVEYIPSHWWGRTQWRNSRSVCNTCSREVPHLKRFQAVSKFWASLCNNFTYWHDPVKVMHIYVHKYPVEPAWIPISVPNLIWNAFIPGQDLLALRLKSLWEWDVCRNLRSSMCEKFWLILHHLQGKVLRHWSGSQPGRDYFIKRSTFHLSNSPSPWEGQCIVAQEDEPAFCT